MQRKVSNSLVAKITQQSGLAIQLATECTNDLCPSSKETIDTANTSKRMPNKSFEVNRRVVAASLTVGIGFNLLALFSECLGMPCINNYGGCREKYIQVDQ